MHDVFVILFSSYMSRPVTEFGRVSIDTQEKINIFWDRLALTLTDFYSHRRILNA